MSFYVSLQYIQAVKISPSCQIGKSISNFLWVTKTFLSVLFHLAIFCVRPLLTRPKILLIELNLAAPSSIINIDFIVKKIWEIY